MSDLIAKLRAALDEDERVAREACDNDSGEWFDGDDWNVWRAEEIDPHDELEQHELVVYGNVKPQSEHIARHDPARALRQVAAMRKVLDLAERLDFYETDNCLVRMPDPQELVLALAEAYGIEP
jgi:hypothetical protein